MWRAVPVAAATLGGVAAGTRLQHAAQQMRWMMASTGVWMQQRGLITSHRVPLASSSLPSLALPSSLRSCRSAILPLCRSSARKVAVAALHPRGLAQQQHKEPQPTVAVTTTADGVPQSSNSESGTSAVPAPLFEPPFPSIVPVSLWHRTRFIVLECAVLVVSFDAAIVVTGGLLAFAPPSSLSDPVILLTTANLGVMGCKTAIYLALTQLMQRKGWQWMKLPPSVPAATAAALLTGAKESSSGGGGSARSRPRASWQRTVLVLVGGSVLSLGLVAVSGLRDDSTVEDFHVRQLALDGRWLPSVMIGLLGPINEEILYRALLFARCVRMLGLPVALLIQFAVFGGVHASDTSEKVLLAGSMGVILALSYCASGGVLLVPIAIHAANNSLAVLQATEVSPLRMHEQLEQGKEAEEDGMLIESATREVQAEEWLTAAKRMLVRIRTALGLLRVPDKEGRAPQLSDGVYAFFQPDDPTLQTLRPEVRQMIGTIFASLDRGGKGYLTPDELAWAVQLSPEERINTAAAWQVIERRVRASPTATDGAVIKTATTNSPVVSDQLCPDFFSAQQIAANRARLLVMEQANPSLAALVPPNPLVDAKALVKLLMVVDRRSAKNCCCSVESASGESKQQQPFPQEAQPAPSPDVHLSAQLRCFHAYLNKRARTRAAMVSSAASRSEDDDDSSGSGSVPSRHRVTRDAFEHYVARQLLMHPGEGATWLASVRAALLDEHNAHSTRELLHEMKTLADSTHNCTRAVRTQTVEHMENKLRA